MVKIPEKILNTTESVKPARNWYTKHGKRVFDIIISLVSLIVLSPLLVIVCMLELIFHGHPIFYHTMRPGRNGVPFRLYKFRSMTNECDKNGYFLTEDKRLTKFGRMIRKTSIDELPQLYNVLKGDLSIIGPRPLLMEYLNYYALRHSMRHYVRPGLACLPLNRSSNTIWTWAEQFESDIWYVENLCLKTDVRELIAISKQVICPSNARVIADRVPFMGNETLYETRSIKEAGYDSIVFKSLYMKDTTKKL